MGQGENQGLTTQRTSGGGQNYDRVRTTKFLFINRKRNDAGNAACRQPQRGTSSMKHDLRPEIPGALNETSANVG